MISAYTEEEAGKKWCPFARVVGEVQENETGAYNRGAVGDISTSAHCYGSACMAWRWMKCEDDDDKQLGHCGLAGVPDLYA